jgi:hypothetical protein
MKVELFSVPGCPNVARVRELLRDCMEELRLPMEMSESQGEYPSPSILVDGIDVMGDPGYRAAACRLDIPDRRAILRALQQP